jgi:hypothetical protein
MACATNAQMEGSTEVDYFQFDSIHSVVLVTILFFYYRQTQQSLQR